MATAGAPGWHASALGHAGWQRQHGKREVGWGGGRVVGLLCDVVVVARVSLAARRRTWGCLSSTAWRAAHARMHACGHDRVRSSGCLASVPCCARDGRHAPGQTAPLFVVHACPCPSHAPRALVLLRACARVSGGAPPRLRSSFVHAAASWFRALRPRVRRPRVASGGAGRLPLDVVFAGRWPRGPGLLFALPWRLRAREEERSSGRARASTRVRRRVGRRGSYVARCRCAVGSGSA